jgi:hypothetical protein
VTLKVTIKRRSFPFSSCPRGFGWLGGSKWEKLLFSIYLMHYCDSNLSLSPARRDKLRVKSTGRRSKILCALHKYLDYVENSNKARLEVLLRQKWIISIGNMHIQHDPNVKTFNMKISPNYDIRDEPSIANFASTSRSSLLFIP